MARILLVEDEKNILKMTQMMLAKAGHEVTGMASGTEAISWIGGFGEAGLPIDVVFTDYRLNDVTGIDVLHAVKRADARVEVILVTAYASAQTAVTAMRDGACDYIEKPFKREQLLDLIAKAMRRQAPRLPVDEKRNLVGSSDKMKQVVELVKQVAPTRANILITGESGTGKEVVARLVHRWSGLAGAFVPVNCGAIPESLVESEFFGYAKGAFTGATRDRAGFFQAAQGGTLFLDEIGELPIAMQVKLLRAIQERRIQPVGSTKEEPVSVRIIAATNRDLRTEVDEHRFREDLFFRLNVIQIAIPSLRDRREDIPQLVQHFIAKFNAELGRNIDGVDPIAMELLTRHDYRGNVRELENILEHAVTLERGSQITVGVLPAYIREIGLCDAPEPPSIPPAPTTVSAANPRVTAANPRVTAANPRVSATQRRAVSRDIADADPNVSSNFPAIDEYLEGVDVGGGVELEKKVEELEKKLIDQALEKTGNNKTEAAKLLGITFRSLRYRLKKYGYE